MATVKYISIVAPSRIELFAIALHQTAVDWRGRTVIDDDHFVIVLVNEEFRRSRNGCDHGLEQFHSGTGLHFSEISFRDQSPIGLVGDRPKVKHIVCTILFQAG
jgi:hypothetical protein